ncbi:hypothetical protein [Streptomyces sp. NPDC090083]|uniref:hypothetical protein n=1 Tax=Streptomyces sp. NPDC090083 TaxID=3365941 RepID=UPI0038131F15
MPTSLAALMAFGSPAMVGFALWRFFPDGIPGAFRTWSAIRTEAKARKLLGTDPDPETALAVLQLLHDAERASSRRAVPSPRDRPPTPDDAPP